MPFPLGHTPPTESLWGWRDHSHTVWFLFLFIGKAEVQMTIDCMGDNWNTTHRTRYCTRKKDRVETWTACWNYYSGPFYFFNWKNHTHERCCPLMVYCTFHTAELLIRSSFWGLPVKYWKYAKSFCSGSPNVQTFIF